MENPIYLVQVDDETIYGYWNELIVKSDILINKEKDRVKVFKVVEDGLILKYRQVNKDEI